ncbi:hypothetical protein [Protofrankia sp. BMG5.30]|uniref:hypothetical protein n=1 Tax=Protofrankia sp. BMG5.30 TaxID=1834514 RepID=UPI0009CD848D|nr:hypothetical protein [Protofrankia sp. BMG5.30]ONH37256.1 hypothetical protein BL254_04175 [Protofrankia sp. BMG5.30]
MFDSTVAAVATEATAAVPATATATGAQAHAVQTRVLARGGRGSHSLFRQALRRAVLAVDPDGSHRRHTHAPAKNDGSGSSRPRTA